MGGSHRTQGTRLVYSLIPGDTSDKVKQSEKAKMAPACLPGLCRGLQQNIRYGLNLESCPSGFSFWDKQIGHFHENWVFQVPPLNCALGDIHGEPIKKFSVPYSLVGLGGASPIVFRESCFGDLFTR